MWPLSVRTVYTAGTVPAIKAADLVAIQEAIVGIYAGTLSVKALEIEDEKQAMADFGSSDSGASLGDILGAAIRQKQEAEKAGD